MKKRLSMLLLASVACVLSACGANTGLCNLLNRTANKVDVNADRYTVGNGKFHDKVETLEIDWTSGSVSIVTTKDDLVTITEETSEELPDEKRVHWWLDGTTLRIKYSAACLGLLTEPNEKIHAEKNLTVTLPESMDLTDLVIDTASSDVMINGVKTDTLRVDAASANVTFDGEAETIQIGTSSGDASIHTLCDVKEIRIDTASGGQNLDIVNAESAQLDTSSGKIQVTAHTISNVKIGTASGPVECAFEQTPEKFDAGTASGSVALILPEDADFALRMNTASGRFQSDFDLSKKGKDYICGNGDAALSIKTASGNITVRK